MGRMIDADALMELYADRLTVVAERYSPDSSECGILSGAMKLLEIQPTIEPKNGKWRRRLVDCGFNADWHCSRCGWKTSLEEHGYNFCPNCGADMRGEEDD